MTKHTKTTNIFAAVALFAAASAWAADDSALSLNIAEDDTLVIDDFEDGNLVSNLGEWELGDEKKKLTTHSYSVVKSKETGSKVLKIDYEFKTSYQWDDPENYPYALVEPRVYLASDKSLRDLSSCSEITFDYKLSQNLYDVRFRIISGGKAFENSENANYFAYNLGGMGTEWRTVVLHWDAFEQIDIEYYGIEADINDVRKNVLSFGWMLHSDEPTSGTLELDNIRCINRPLYEIKFMVDGKEFLAGRLYKGETPIDPVGMCENCPRPSREPTEDLMYTFTGWDKKLVPITENTTYTAQFKEEKIPAGKPLDWAGDTIDIENFEDGNMVSELNGPWVFFDSDHQNGGAKTSKIATESANKVLKIGYQEGEYQWLGARLFLLSDSSAVDMSQCQAIQYRYKGRSHQFRIESIYEIEEDWMHWHVDVPESNDWTVNVVTWNDLVGYDWYEFAPLNRVELIRKKVTELTWQFDSQGTTEDDGFEIDDIQCIRNFPKYEIAFYSEDKLLEKATYPYATYFSQVALPEEPVKQPENGTNYVFTGWTPKMESNSRIMKNLRLDAEFVPVKPLLVSGQTLLLDNFDDGDLVNELGGAWSSFKDNYSSTIDMKVSGEKANKWLNVQYVLKAWVGIKMDLQKDGGVMDLSQCDAIQYNYRGGPSSHQFRIESILDNAELAAHYQTRVDKPEEKADNSTDWFSETIFLDSLKCEDGTDCVPLAKAKKSVSRLAWNFWSSSPEGGKTTIEIDSVRCRRTDFGAVQIALDQSKAIIDGSYLGDVPLDFPNDIEVSQVEFKRTFEENVSSTLMLPFSIDVSKVEGADFYSFAKMDYEYGEWKAGAKKVTGTLEANTPYMTIATESEIQFKLDEDETVRLSTVGVTETVTEIGEWEFRGTYNPINLWDSLQLLGRAYGFAGEEKNNVKIGDFVKLGSGASIPLMRNYLVKIESKSSQCSAGMLCAPRLNREANAAVASTEELPDRIAIEFIDEEDEVKTVGVLDARTGKIRLDRYHLDRWYDLRGRRVKGVQGKSAAKGVYLSRP